MQSYKRIYKLIPFWNIVFYSSAADSYLHIHTNKSSMAIHCGYGGFPLYTERKVSASYYFLFKARSTFTAQATEQPTIGLLPMPRKPIIST